MVLIEDITIIITTGGAAAATALRDLGASVTTVVCAIDRSTVGASGLAGEGIPARAVLTKDLLNALPASQTLRICRAWYAVQLRVQIDRSGHRARRARGRQADCCCADQLRPRADRVGAVGPDGLDGAPNQREGAPRAWIRFDEQVAEGAEDLRPGDEIVVLTWLHLSPRDELSTHPEDDMRQPLTGVFSTCSPNRPNPIGLHRARIVARDGLRIEVDALEAIDGTPVVDVKPAIDPPA